MTDGTLNHGLELTIAPSAVNDSVRNSIENVTNCIAFRAFLCMFGIHLKLRFHANASEIRPRWIEWECATTFQCYSEFAYTKSISIICVAETIFTQSASDQPICCFFFSVTVTLLKYCADNHLRWLFFFSVSIANDCDSIDNQRIVLLVCEVNQRAELLFSNNKISHFTNSNFDQLETRWIDCHVCDPPYCLIVTRSLIYLWIHAVTVSKL